MKKKVIRRKENFPPAINVGGNSLTEIIGNTVGPEGSAASLAHVTMAPGKSDPYHYHKNLTEVYYILDGHARMLIDDVEYDLDTNDSVIIPPYAKHKLFNESSRNCHFIVFCTPAWSQDDEYLA